MKLGRDVSRHDVLDNWRNTHRYESVIAIIWLFWTISETDPGLWDRLLGGTHRSGRATGDHQDPAATLLLPGRTAYPLGAQTHFASSPGLALG